MKRNIYIVITHSKSPVKSDPEKTNIAETCEFVDRIKNEHIKSATVILNYTERTIEKNREKQGTFNDFLRYVNEKYPDQMAELRERFNA